jgi:hypothetical protein
MKKHDKTLWSDDQIMAYVQRTGFIIAVPEYAPLSSLLRLAKQGKLRQVDKQRGWYRFEAVTREL